MHAPLRRFLAWNCAPLLPTSGAPPPLTQPPLDAPRKRRRSLSPSGPAGSASAEAARQQQLERQAVQALRRALAAVGVREGRLEALDLGACVRLLVHDVARWRLDTLERLTHQYLACPAHWFFQVDAGALVGDLYDATVPPVRAEPEDCELPAEWTDALQQHCAHEAQRATAREVLRQWRRQPQGGQPRLTVRFEAQQQLVLELTPVRRVELATLRRLAARGEPRVDLTQQSLCVRVACPTPA